MINEEKLFSKAAKLAEVVLITGGAAALLQFFYVLYFYAWTGEKKFSSPSAGMLYYGIPAALAILLFASLRLSRRAKINFAFLCLSLFSSAYAAELLLRVTGAAKAGPRQPVMLDLRQAQDRQKKAAKLTRRFDTEIDSRSAREVLDEWLKRGVDAVPIMSPRLIRIDSKQVVPLGAISNRLTVLCNENGSWVSYKSDEHGFNNPKGIWQSGPIEIAALGDSFTHGYCVPPERNFVALIRQDHPATLNLGMAGNGPLLMLATLKEYLPALKPKVVLWFYFEGNDLLDLQAERKTNLLMRYLGADFNQGLLLQQRDIDRVLIEEIDKEKAESLKRRKEPNKSEMSGEVLEFAKLSALRSAAGLVEGKSREEVITAADLQGPNMDIFRDILSEANSRVSAWGGRLQFVYLPGVERYDHYTDIGSKQRRPVLDLVRALDIPLIDIDPAFQAMSDPLSVFPFRGPGHYNARGHRVVAEAVLKALPVSIN